MNHRLSLTCAALLLAVSPAVAQQSSVVNTKHNLSTSGPGTFTSTNESRICIFCHTPHRARTTAPLWNREDSRETYVIYDSSTFGGVTTQPTGSSKLCLSCHDGSIALGAVVHSDTSIMMEPGKDYLTSGGGALGTMLDDDHPISFHYSTSKGGSGVEYLPEASITPPVNVDADGLMQCTSCHDSHDNTYGDFLHASDRYGAVCLSCHQPTDWAQASHAQSTANWDGVGQDPLPGAQYPTVSENSCRSCHKPHGAGRAERLLGKSIEENNCMNCHNGHTAAKNLTSDFMRVSNHSPVTTLGVHDAAEDPLSMPRHSECEDCHNPHAAKAGDAAAPNVPGPLTGIDGITTSGQPIERIMYGYQLCYKCHADNNGGVSYQPRQIVQTNTRLEFDPSNPSYHPVEAPGASNDVPSLLPPYTTSSVITCTDCHQSDTSPDAGGNGPKGPHGSNISPLLIAEYRTDEYVTESPSAYALCYRCHSRASILGDESFKEHHKHIVKEDSTCSACHDPHGISSTQGNSINNSHLINLNNSYVTANSQGQFRFVDEGFRAGNCSLDCHGEDHRQENYP